MGRAAVHHDAEVIKVLIKAAQEQNLSQDQIFDLISVKDDSNNQDLTQDLNPLI
jgi:hypothetical protein